MTKEMNELNGQQMSRNAFSKLFNEIDTDGDNTVSLDELIGAFCHLFKIEQVKTDDYKRTVPSGLLEKNQMIRTSLRRLAVSKGQNSCQDGSSSNLVIHDQKNVKFLLQQLWSMYDMDGNGFLNKREVKHFCDKHFKYHLSLCESVPANIFDAWYSDLDSDGDGQVGITELTNSIQELVRLVQTAGKSKYM